MKNPRALILEVTDPDNFNMSIDITSLPGIDYALNMLSQATRILEAKQRFLAEQALVEQEMRRAADQQLVSLVGGRKQ